MTERKPTNDKRTNGNIRKQFLLLHVFNCAQSAWA